MKTGLEQLLVLGSPISVNACQQICESYQRVQVLGTVAKICSSLDRAMALPALDRKVRHGATPLRIHT